MRNYYTQYNIGTAKYVLNTYDGLKTHSDGSPFYDIQIFKSRAKLNEAIAKFTGSNHA